MIPITFFYDEYIDRPKLTEQKNPFEHIAPYPTSGVGTINVIADQHSVKEEIKVIIGINYISDT